MREIALTKGMKALVDDDDFDRVSQYKWSFGGKYAVKGVGPKKKHTSLYLHRFILQANRGVMCDHINGNTLDNRKENLRICSAQENAFNKGINSRNTSGYKGVYWHKASRKWMARIAANKKYIYLGCFEKIEDAVRAYNIAAPQYHGNFARTNLINI